MSRNAAFSLIFTVSMTSGASHAGTEINKPFDNDYVFSDLGAVPGVPTPYGGLVFDRNDPNKLLIGGTANQPSGAIYAIDVVRGCTGIITGFAGKAELVADAPQIDGGLAYAPNGTLLFTGYPDNTLGQIMPGSTSPDKVVDLTPLGVVSSVGTMQVVPQGFPGEGSLKLGSFNGDVFHDAVLEADGKGTYDVTNVSDPFSTPGGPEGMAYISGDSPEFGADSVLISLYSWGTIGAFDIDEDGNPLADSYRPVLTGLTGTEGATTDPVTGDFLFSTFGAGSRVVILRGFVDPCRADLAPNGGDGVIDTTDLLQLLGAWGQSCVVEDVNDDTLVDVIDLLNLLSVWGPCE